MELNLRLCALIGCSISLPPPCAVLLCGRTPPFMQPRHTRSHSHTEVLPFVSVRIPCIAPTRPQQRPDADNNAARCSSFAFASQPRLLPVPLMILLLLFFVGLTALAVGSSGLTAFSAYVTGSPVSHLPVADPLLHASTTKPAPRSMRSSSSMLSWLPLVPLPPVNAVPSGWLFFDEYLSLYVWLFRSFIARPLWHVLVWWHILCGLVSLVSLVRWRCQQPAADAPSLPSFLAHSLFWLFHSLVFGWPALYLLRGQLDAKTKNI